MPLFTTERPAGIETEDGELVHAIAISGANIIRDLREHITNTIGGAMTRYETLTDQTLERALADLEAKARERGYDGVTGIRIAHPHIVDGAVAVLVYGTAYRLKR
jgi:uncharacterized protein YbjQ (UPF0145 family)